MKDTIIGFVATLVVIMLVGVSIYYLIASHPTTEEQVREIKFCEENGLTAYSTESGHWRCKPLSKS